MVCTTMKRAECVGDTFLCSLWGFSIIHHSTFFEARNIVQYMSSTGGVFIAQVVGASTHGDDFWCITYEGQDVTNDLVPLCVRGSLLPPDGPHTC